MDESWLGKFYIVTRGGSFNVFADCGEGAAEVFESVIRLTLMLQSERNLVVKRALTENLRKGANLI